MNSVWIIIGSLLFTTFFAGIEIAFANLNKLRLELDIKHGGVNSRILPIFLKNTTLFGITVFASYYTSLILFGASIAATLQSWFGNTFIYPQLFIPAEIIIATLFVIITAELLARTVILLNPNRILNIFLIPVLVFYILFFPIAWLLFQLISGYKSLFAKGKNGNDAGLRPIALYDKWLFENPEKPEQDKEINQEVKMFQKALAFSNVRIRDCMIPRNEIETIDVNAGIEALKKKFISSGYSKILVYRNSVENIIGYVNSKELFKHPSSIKEKLNQISFYPETMPASKLLHEFTHYHRSIGVVVDEYGGVSGMVTLEDIMEEIFGEIEDEHDTDDLLERRIRSNEFVLSCRLEIEYLNAKYHINFPESEDYDTLAGFILFHYHNFPKTNEIIRIGNFMFKILKVSTVRIELVYLKIEET